MKIYYSKYKYIEIVIRRRIAFEKFRNNKFRKDSISKEPLLKFNRAGKDFDFSKHSIGFPYNYENLVIFDEITEYKLNKYPW